MQKVLAFDIQIKRLVLSSPVELGVCAAQYPFSSRIHFLGGKILSKTKVKAE